MQVKTFSQACENNKEPIFNILASHLEKIPKVVEIGSGSGTAACRLFYSKMPHLLWQTTDQGKYFLQLLIDNRMPANNRLLHFIKKRELYCSN